MRILHEHYMRIFPLHDDMFIICFFVYEWIKNESTRSFAFYTCIASCFSKNHTKKNNFKEQTQKGTTKFDSLTHNTLAKYMHIQNFYVYFVILYQSISLYLFPHSFICNSICRFSRKIKIKQKIRKKKNTRELFGESKVLTHFIHNLKFV